MKIKMLNHETINKIAAGEVIIRPVSVIKELVENAIDAASTRICVSVEKGGKASICVTDNGTGIAYNEVPLAFKRHATSKILTLNDLETIDTLGFRGEALSSIAAVSHVRITTRDAEEEIGSQSFFENSEMINQRVCPYENGTEILVTDLFYNTPARQKHLQKGKNEEKFVRDILEKLSMSHPEIQFEYISDGRLVFRTSGSGKLQDVIESLYGRQFFSGLRELKIDNDPMHLRGYISDLTLTRSTKEEQIFFINNRYVKNKCLSRAFEEAYEGYMMLHRHPLGIIFMSLPGRMLDINIHPAKTEIQILNESLVSMLFKQGIRDALRAESLIVDIAEPENDQKQLDEANSEKTEEPLTFIDPEEQHFVSEQTTKLPKEGEKITKESAISKPVVQFEGSVSSTAQPVLYRQQEPETKAYAAENVVEMHAVKSPDFSNARIIGQLFSTYILLEKGDEILMIDQHAAHEAFMYQELKQRFAKEETFPAQTLLIPQRVEISLREAEEFDAYQEALKQYGFDCDLCGPSQLIVRSVPIILGEPQSTELLRAFIEYRSYEDAEKSKSLIEKIISMSCKSAIKGHQDLSIDEIRALLDHLSKLENPYTCPHGRPIILRLKEYDLKKLFKRVV